MDMSITEQKMSLLLQKTDTSSPFNSEQSLIKIVVKEINKFITGEAIVSTELIIGAGRVDIVAAIVIDKKSLYQPAISDVEAYILSLLHYKRPLKSSTIARRASMQLEQVLGILEQLSKKKFILNVGNCFIRQQSSIEGLIAIEGKIRNWKKALHQAYRNRLFTSQTYVALDARYSKPALRNIDIFKDYRVGLAIVFSDGNVDVVYRPPKAQPLAPVMPIIAETALLQEK